MASWNRSRDANSDPDEHSGGTWRRPLPRPDHGDNIRPVPLWEREFCRNAYDTPWVTFCENKRSIGFYKNVMDCDDSGALKNFLDAKERFRARYFGEPYEDPVLDPELYIDEVNHHCEVDANLVAGLDKIGISNLTPMSLGEPTGNLIPPPRWGEPVADLKPTGWGEPPAHPPSQVDACGGQGIQTPETSVRGARPYCTRVAEGQYQRRNGGGMQQQGQRRRRMEWRLVQHKNGSQ